MTCTNCGIDPGKIAFLLGQHIDWVKFSDLEVPSLTAHCARLPEYVQIFQSYVCREDEGKFYVSYGVDSDPEKSLLKAIKNFNKKGGDRLASRLTIKKPTADELKEVT